MLYNVTQNMMNFFPIFSCSAAHYSVKQILN
jgi:hypothetical protein